jgi:DNA-directed RNA polymerase I and III subunit RPAC1
MFINYDLELMDTPVNIESESFYPPERLLPEAIKVMRGKIATIRKAAEALLADSDALDGGVAAIEVGGEVRIGIPGEAGGEGDVIMMDT